MTPIQFLTAPPYQGTDVKKLGENSAIGSLNFGESRRFLLRLKSVHQDKFGILLGHSNLLIMWGSQ